MVTLYILNGIRPSKLLTRCSTPPRLDSSLLFPGTQTQRLSIKFKVDPGAEANDNEVEPGFRLANHVQDRHCVVTRSSDSPAERPENGIVPPHISEVYIERRTKLISGSILAETAHTIAQGGDITTSLLRVGPQIALARLTRWRS